MQVSVSYLDTGRGGSVGTVGPVGSSVKAPEREAQKAWQKEWVKWSMTLGFPWGLSLRPRGETASCLPAT